MIERFEPIRLALEQSFKSSVDYTSLTSIRIATLTDTRVGQKLFECECVDIVELLQHRRLEQADSDLLVASGEPRGHRHGCMLVTPREHTSRECMLVPGLETVELSLHLSCESVLSFPEMKTAAGRYSRSVAL